MREITIWGELSLKESTLRLIRGLQGLPGDRSLTEGPTLRHQVASFKYVGSLEEVICLALEANIFGCVQPPLLQTICPSYAV